MLAMTTTGNFNQAIVLDEGFLVSKWSLSSACTNTGRGETYTVKYDVYDAVTGVDEYTTSGATFLRSGQASFSTEYDVPVPAGDTYNVVANVYDEAGGLVDSVTNVVAVPVG
jgi:hypothetical protein